MFELLILVWCPLLMQLVLRHRKPSCRNLLSMMHPLSIHNLYALIMHPLSILYFHALISHTCSLGLQLATRIISSCLMQVDATTFPPFASEAYAPSTGGCQHWGWRSRAGTPCDLHGPAAERLAPPYPEGLASASEHSQVHNFLCSF